MGRPASGSARECRLFQDERTTPAVPTFTGDQDREDDSLATPHGEGGVGGSGGDNAVTRGGKGRDGEGEEGGPGLL